MAKAEGEVRPNLLEVVGIRNKLRVITGKEPEYSAETLGKIAVRGILSDFYSRETVRDAFLGSGLSSERAKEEADSRVVSLSP